MSFKRVPPFSFVPTISEGIKSNAERPSLARLRDIAAGRERTTFPRSQSLSMLLGTDLPNKHRDFEQVLSNELESPELRYLAAVNLGSVGTPAAMEVLVRMSRVQDELVLAGVMRALGRIGDRSVLDAIATARAYATGLAARQAEFAATLISHRICSDEYATPVTASVNADQLDLRCARPIRIDPLGGVDAELCLRSLGRQPFGLELSEYPMYQVRCGRSVSMILLNRAFVVDGNVESLTRRRGFLGVVAARADETRAYSVSYLLLSAPVESSGDIVLRIHRPNGDLAFAGTAQVVDDCAEFTIGAVRRPGAFAIGIDGSFADGALNVTNAVSAMFAQVPKREPIDDPAAHGNLDAERRIDFG